MTPRIRAFAAILLASLAAAGSAGAELLHVLVEERAMAEFGAEFPANGQVKVHVQGDPGEAHLLSAFWMDKATGQFIANAVSPQGAVTRVTGLATVTVPVPVPQRRMMPDEIITAQDLAVIELPLSRVGAYAVSDAQGLVGMQVRSLLAKGRPILNRSVRPPLVIDRGDKVSIRYQDGLLELSAPGRALGDAHRGQEVKIVNLVSNASVIGIATAEGIVEVSQ
ncbi:flagellar basal body P-ring formation chaperone FlgA [Profundibacterium mesophilum]|uniref:Flagella basal body P-ring formation protein FlgA n=1 Tax=Profundibacterium mesophilum KAUST100406-0324 TaxID=1037889 RepID=A0A921NTV3_9RHOB|nr:flagellar basal body P-ring formation chaperone FlgA [Profundibacterium mesophilum]KAF0674649.1 Flagellar basal-body P-ring formation protein FlgA [Profundibacterium mesophilum KAUST100406-0324]